MVGCHVRVHGIQGLDISSLYFLPWSGMPMTACLNRDISVVLRKKGLERKIVWRANMDRLNR